METEHSDKEAWAEKHCRGEHMHTGTSAGRERMGGGEEKGLSVSSDGEEEEAGEVEEDISQGMEEAANYEEFAQDFYNNPFLNYDTPMDQMSEPGFYGNMQAVPGGSSTDGEAKQVESGSEEGEIADDEPNEQDGDAEEVCAVHMWVSQFV